jgi:iron complex transport system substrate-binding protein
MIAHHPLLRRVLAGSAALGLAASMAACSTDGGSGEAGSEETAAQSGSGAPEGVDIPEGWTWIEGTGIPSTEADPQLPTTVTDGTGSEAEVTDLERIIVGGEDVADILAAMGLQENIYAAPTNSVAEAALAAPEQFEFSQQTGVEGLLSVDGTLFIGNNVKRHGDVAAQFRDAGVDAVVVDDQQPIADKIRSVGEYVGAAEAGEDLAGQVEAQLDEAAEAAAGSAEGQRVLAVTSSGAGGANAVVGTGTAAQEIIEATGATSVGVEEGLRGYSVEYSDEGLLGTEPDVILVGDGDLEEWGGYEGFLEAFPTLAETPAMQNDRVFVMPSEQIKVSGVGVGAGAAALAEALADTEQ